MKNRPLEHELHYSRLYKHIISLAGGKQCSSLIGFLQGKASSGTFFYILVASDFRNHELMSLTNLGRTSQTCITLRVSLLVRKHYCIFIDEEKPAEYSKT